jgi:hypothetical protein
MGWAELICASMRRSFQRRRSCVYDLSCTTQPCVVMEGEPPLQQVCSLNTKARLLGMEHAMTRVEVDTFPQPTVLSRSLQSEAATMRASLTSIACTFVRTCSAPVNLTSPVPGLRFA